MRTQEYWEQVALLREQYAQKNADEIIQQIMRLYDEAEEEIAGEIEKVLSAFGKLSGLDRQEAEAYISKAEQDRSVRELRKLYAQADSEQERDDLIRRINAQAYGARMKRWEAVQEKAYTAVKKAAAEERRKLEKHLRGTYADTYYQTVYDIGKGVNTGIDFAVVSDRQIQEAVTRPWEGRTFADSVWTNTDTLARQAGELIQRGMTTGADVYQMADQIADLSKKGKYAATRLVRTETNHICNQAQLDAYDGAGIEQYKFLATLDYRTCEVCQPLDGKVFYRSEARGGVNYPTMHPNCRCTTTIPTAYLSRWANDGGHKYKVDGDVTFSQWTANMTPEQKQAFEVHVKQWRNRAADKKRYERYIDRLGKENVPKTFDLFQEKLYTDLAWKEEIEGFYRYKGKNSRAVLNDYRCAKELAESGIKGDIHIPAKEIDIESLGFDDFHINSERLHNVSEQEAKTYIENALVSITKRNGLTENYYSKAGAAYVNPINQEIKTAFSKDEFDDKTKLIMEVLHKYGF